MHPDGSFPTRREQSPLVRRSGNKPGLFPSLTSTTFKSDLGLPAFFEGLTGNISKSKIPKPATYTNTHVLHFVPLSR